MTSITDLIHCIQQQQYNTNGDSSNWNLYLGTKGPTSTNNNHMLVLEDLDDIQDGDRIVLAKNDKHTNDPTNATTNLQEDDTHHQHEMSSSSTDSEYEEDNMDSDTSSIIDVTSDYRDNHTTKVEDDSSIEDVTDYYQNIKQKQMKDLIKQAHVIQDDEMKKQTTPSKQQRTSKTKKQQKEKQKPTTFIHISPIQVIMKEKDIPIAPGCPQSPSNDEENNGEQFDNSNTILHNNNTEKMNESIKNRILKLLNTGFHENSNENEAKNAMRLAQRLMQRHNINQALLLQEYKDKNANNNVDGNDEILKGGLVTVELYHNTSTQKNKGRRKPMSSMIRWIAYLIYPVRLNFKVEAYKTVSRNPPQCSVTFYGIYTNAQLAAYAFKIACERIATMVASYTPTTNNNTASFTKKARLSYGLGIVEGLTKDVESNKEKEELRRQEKLKKARDAVQKGEAHDESSDDDDDDDDDDEYSSFGTLSNFNSNKNDDSNDKEKEEKAKVRLKVLEKEESAALALMDHHERIAKDILKESNIKVYKASKRRALKFDSQSYQRGIEDSKEIDLDQRAIRGNSQVVKEELRKRNTKIPS